MREWRVAHPDQYDEHSRARGIANVYQARGHLKPEPCGECGSTENVEKHHDDYARPLEVRWLCRSCHREHHRKEAA